MTTVKGVEGRRRSQFEGTIAALVWRVLESPGNTENKARVRFVRTTQLHKRNFLSNVKGTHKLPVRSAQ